MVVLITAIFYLLNPKRILWWEALISIGITCLMILIIKLIINHISVQFTEYWGETIVSIVEEEPYNYWKHETCSDRYPCGTDQNGNTKYCTRYYDCSHQVDVGPKWWCKTNLNNTYELTECEHDNIKKQFNSKLIQTAFRQNYDPNDRGSFCSGTKFENKKVGPVSYTYTTFWTNSDNSRKGIFTKHFYENRIKASDLSQFDITPISEEEAIKLKLYEYPKLNNHLTFPTILGTNIPENVQEKFRKLNAKFGVSNKMRLWVLIFYNQPSSIATKQENYWVVGNKNELTLCIGLNTQNDIQWTHSFSWSLSKDLITDITKTSLEIGNLNDSTWNVLYNYLDDNLHKFKKRSFEEFNYLTVEPKLSHIVILYILTLIITICINLWSISNEYQDNSKRNIFDLLKYLKTKK